MTKADEKHIIEEETEKDKLISYLKMLMYDIEQIEIVPGFTSIKVEMPTFDIPDERLGVMQFKSTGQRIITISYFERQKPS